MAWTAVARARDSARLDIWLPPLNSTASLRRGDAVAQAVSLLRAEQTNVWFQTAQDANKEPQREPRFDLDELRARVHLVGDHNAAWQEWFSTSGIQPYPVLYEELDADPIGVTRGVLDFLELEVPASAEIVVQHKRLADHLNARWINRYRAEGCSSC